MQLDLSYPSRYHLWAALSRGQLSRIFVEADLSESAPCIGESVTLRLMLPELLLPVSLSAKVVGRRRKSRRFPEGIYLRLASRQIEKVRHILGLSGDGEERLGRRKRRVPAELDVRFTSPSGEERGLARNISESGLLVEVPLALTSGQIVEMTVSLDDGTELTLRAEAMWTSAESKAVGFHFVELEDSSRQALRECVARLWARYQQGPGGPIVVADDELEIQILITKALQASGYTVYKASTGAEAMGLIRELQPDLVVLDILMPSIDGMEVCKAMRADEELADVPVVFVSALQESDLHRVAEEAGATDYLSKPVNLNDLLDLVGSYLKERRAEIARSVA